MINQSLITPLTVALKNTNAHKHLYSQAKLDRLAHAYLLETSDSFAALILARSIASIFLKPENIVLQGRHADLFEAPKELNDKIIVDTVDSIIEDTIKRPSEGEKKFYIINNFDSANIQSQNKLLKTLEEPPVGTCFFLIAKNCNSIVPPILSRCQSIVVDSFSTIDLEVMLVEAKIKNLDDNSIALASSLANGSITLAINFLTDKKQQAVFSATLNALLQLKSSKNVLAAVALLAPYKDYLVELLQHITTIFQDVLYLHTNSTTNIKLKTIKTELQQLQQMYSLKAISAITLFLTTINKRIQSNANHNSLLDDLFFTIAQKRVI